MLKESYICKKHLLKTRYFIFISFKGTSYHGWQLQPNSVTVQKILDDALSTILQDKITTTGAGRTDTGVHASFFCAHFDSELKDLASKKNLIFRLNRYLPEDISISRIAKVQPAAHARFSAFSRTYHYNISKIKNPFEEESAWFINCRMDTKLMNKACAELIKHTDFTSFSRLHSDNKTNICKIMQAEWHEDEKNLVFTIKADRFLRNMVRAIVGTMADIGTGKISLRKFREIIEARDRCKAGTSAPARGLFLVNIEYPEEIFT
jgi:tRNA pseudouridine38-40 synthase